MAGMDHWLRHHAKFKHSKKFDCKEIVDYINEWAAEEDKVELVDNCEETKNITKQTA